jgi:hypothetical protein
LNIKFVELIAFVAVYLLALDYFCSHAVGVNDTLRAAFAFAWLHELYGHPKEPKILATFLEV